MRGLSFARVISCDRDCNVRREERKGVKGESKYREAIQANRGNLSSFDLVRH